VWVRDPHWTCEEDAEYIRADLHRAEVEELTLEIARLRRSQAMIVETSAGLCEELARARGYASYRDMRRAELMEQSDE
jgi:hypothetical protein